MKVVYIIGFDINEVSGKSKATREKIRVLRDKLGVQNFSVYSNNRKDNLMSKLFGLFLFDLSVFSALIFRKRDFYVVQRVLFLPLTRLLLFIKSIKVISECHADLVDEIPHLGKSQLQQFILKLLVPFFNLNYKLSSGIIYNHPDLQEALDRRYKKPSIYSYNGANPKEFTPQTKRLCREELLLEQSETVFLFLGSVSKWHGVEYLINVFNEPAICDRKDLFLYIVGAKDSVYTSYLKSITTNPNIVFKPPVSNLDAQKFINASDYCLLPVNSIRISPGSPLKLYDYIACGKPVIAQEGVRGYSDEVDRYNLGYTVDFTDSQSSSTDLLEIMTDQTDFSQNNREVAVNFVSWENRIDDWLKFINTI